MHSILIPHRSRSRHLRLCVWSICRSARQCGLGVPPAGRADWEIIVIDNSTHGSAPDQAAPEAECSLADVGLLDRRVTIICDNSEMPIFNKSVLYNRGIEAAGVTDAADRPRQRCGNDVLTFLDCDAIVGPEWMLGARALSDRRITRLCYRVRYLNSGVGQGLLTQWPLERERIDDLFSRYNEHRLGYEAYGDADRNHPSRRGGRGRTSDYWRGRLRDNGSSALTDGEDNPHGNSQFSIRRDALGDIRYDEAYVGRGFGDLDINRRIAAAHGENYRGAIDYRPARCLLHLTHSYLADWRTSQSHQKNRLRYRQLKRTLAQRTSVSVPQPAPAQRTVDA
ncbi:hypothetical protein LCGC14_0095380 [marine sediment metagenome]|uniref:Glycosyltransferase 2-like domain-containing protein n=1 Tax=marine sediment metagenome TaxID=412755 RepID=A0A0F9VEN0_9ZZZZ